MSNTPRTDAVLAIAEKHAAGWVQLREHARQLEREVDRLRGECKRLDDGLNRACDRITDLQRQRPVEGISTPLLYNVHCMWLQQAQDSEWKAQWRELLAAIDQHLIRAKYPKQATDIDIAYTGNGMPYRPSEAIKTVMVCHAHHIQDCKQCWPTPLKFASHCPDGQKCGATTTGCMEGECQRDPRLNQPKCHSCGGFVKVEEGGICLPCHTDSDRQ
jgi:hypothetical protein